MRSNFWNHTPGGWIAKKVRQVIKKLEVQIFSDTLLFHVYTFDNRKVRMMAIED